MLLAKNAASTKSFWFVDQWQSFHHIICVQYLHPAKISMSKYAMPQRGFILNFCVKCSLKISTAIFFLVEVLVYFLTFCLECSSCICLSFHVWHYPQRKQAIAFHLYFCYQLVAWTYVFNHIVILLHVDDVPFLYQLLNTQQIVFQTFDMINIAHNLSLPLFG